MHERAVEDRHLGHEAAQPRKAEVRQAGDHIAHRQKGHDLHQTAQLADVARMRPSVDHADQREEKRRHQTVAQHLQHGARGGRLVHHQDGEEHQSAVRHRRVGVDILEVGLHAGRKGAVNHRNRRQDDEYPAQLVRRLRQQVHRHAETAVPAELHQHPGVEHRHGRRGRGVAVGAPGVEGEQGPQHAEAHEDEREPDELFGEGYVVQPGDLHDVHRLGARTEIDAQYADQQEGRAAHEHQRQLHGRILLAAAAPDTDQQVHRDERHLVEEEHREEVHRDEEPEDADAQQAEPQEILLDVTVHPPRGERPGEDDDGRQEQHRHRNAVHAHGVVNVQRRIPHVAVRQEHRRRLARLAQSQEAEDQHDGQHQQQRRSRDHHGADLPRRFRNPKPQHHQKRDEGEQG